MTHLTTDEAPPLSRLLADAACAPWGPCRLVGTRLRPVRRV